MIIIIVIFNLVLIVIIFFFTIDIIVFVLLTNRFYVCITIEINTKIVLSLVLLHYLECSRV